jgi:hypothetical protein
MSKDSSGTLWSLVLYAVVSILQPGILSVLLFYTMTNNMSKI